MAGKKYFTVKNYDEFQHYKDRNPPWIKFYNTTLDDLDLEELSDAEKGHLFLIWLLASKYENKLPYDEKWVARKIGAKSLVNLDVLEQYGFIISNQPRSAQLSLSYENDCLETETETETEKSVASDENLNKLKITMKSGFFIPTSEDISDWKMTYKNVDVETEILKMKEWCFSNPGKRKTKTGVRRFITSWLSRADKDISQSKTPDRKTMNAPDGSNLAEVQAHELKYYGEVITHG